MKKFFVASVFALLMAGGSASAQSGGWIFWMNMAGSEMWAPISGHPTFADCDAKLLRMVQKLGSERSDKQAVYACFPSDFDPRPRK